MTQPNPVFEQTFEHYMSLIQKVSFDHVVRFSGGSLENEILTLYLFDTPYYISRDEIVDENHQRPAHDICVILSRYILMAPDKPHLGNQWVSFRDFKDAVPLLTYFAHDVEQTISHQFSGRIQSLENAGKLLGGYPPEMDIQADMAIEFKALPRINMLLLFNDRDEDFDAAASVLFYARAQHHLDAECLAMLGNHLAYCLRKRAR